MTNKEYLKVYKRIAALCKAADRVIYDAEPDFIYISEEHTLFRMPATAEAVEIFSGLFADRSARGRHGVDHMNEGTAKRIYTNMMKDHAGLIENYIFSVSEKYEPLAGTKAGWRLLACDDPAVYRAMNTKYIDIFSGLEATFSGDKKANNPALVVCGDISGVVLPFNMPKENIAGAIKASEKIAAEKAGKNHGVFFESGIDCVYIDGGRRDDKTIEKIIRYYAAKKGWNPADVDRAAADRATLDSFKKHLYNVTAEKKTRDDGTIFINFYDKKDFFRTEDLEYTNTTDNGIMYFYLGKDRDALRAADLAKKAAEKTENDITTEPAPAAADPEPVKAEPATAKTETAAADHPEPDAGTAEPEPAEPENAPEAAQEPENERPQQSSEAAILASLKDRRARFIKALSEVDPEGVDPMFESMRTDLRCMEEEIAEREADFVTAEPENTEKRDVIARVLAAIADAPTKNTSAILKAGIAADAFTTAELVDYLKNNTLPAVHTFKGWISAGYSVKKGEKALFKADIYEHIRGNYYKRTAAFFGPAQVEKIEGARA